MSATERGQENLPIKLLPHQAAFIDTALSPTSKRFVLLRGDVGLGKTTAMAGLAGRLLRERPGGRVLVLCPAALRFHWLELLRDEGATAILVDRYRFREMLEAGSGGDVWPRGGVAVLSDDFAKQPDIRDSLARVKWDLVIADEAHRFAGVRATLLRHLSVAAERIVLATLPSMASPDALPVEDVTVVHWRRDQLVDLDGKPLDVAHRPVLHEVSFTLSQAERDLSETIRVICQPLEAGTPQQSFIAKSLLRSLHSSPAALERALRNFALPPEEQEEINMLLEDPGELDEEAPTQIEPVAAANVRAIAARALEESEAIQVDSKLNAFGVLLGDLTTPETGPSRVCVLTEFVSTLYYLAADMEGRNLASPLLHGGMPDAARDESLRTFESNGGILIATRSVMTEGPSLPYVTDLVLYDLPTNRLALEEVLGRFDRFGRTTQLRIHALARSDGMDRVLSMQLRVLREIGSGGASEQGR